MLPAAMTPGACSSSTKRMPLRLTPSISPLSSMRRTSLTVFAGRMMLPELAARVFDLFVQEAKSPDERYATMKDVEGALEAFAGVLLAVSCALVLRQRFFATA